MHSLLPGSKLFDFKLYLLITESHKMLKTRLQFRNEWYLHSFVQDIKQTC